MSNKKHGLADLKRLRAQALQEQAKPPAAPKSGKRRRSRQAAAKAGGRQSEDARKRTSSADTSARGVEAGPRLEEATVPQEDVVLFRRAMKFVRPMKPSNRIVLPPVRKEGERILRQRRQAALGAESTAPRRISDQYAPARQDESSYLKAGYGPDLLKGLRAGKWPIQATLDLHGSTLDEARGRLDQFLTSCVQHNVKCVRIIHGKGHGSQNGESVLKDTARRWLAQIEFVLAYTECSEQNGGSGAVQALLKTE